MNSTGDGLVCSDARPANVPVQPGVVSTIETLPMLPTTVPLMVPTPPLAKFHVPLTVAPDCASTNVPAVEETSEELNVPAQVPVTLASGAVTFDAVQVSVSAPLQVVLVRISDHDAALAPKVPERLTVPLLMERTMLSAPPVSAMAVSGASAAKT